MFSGFRHTRFILALGICTGAAMALSQHGMREPPDLTTGIAATAGEVSVSLEDFQRTLAQFTVDIDSNPDPADKAFILGRLIDEALLWEYGVSQDLYRTDRRLRQLLLNVMFSIIIAGEDAAAPLYDNAAVTDKDRINSRSQADRKKRAFDDYLAWLRSRSDINIRM